jgi:minor extracellular serine protease Vpr
VKQANPSLTPLQIKSALVNSAVLTNLTTSDTSAQASVTEVGAGLLQTQNAVKATVQVVPSTVSFGMTGVSLVTSVPLTVYNTSASPITLTAGVVQSAGYSNTTDQVSVSPSTISIPANSNTNVTVNLTGGSPAPGRYEGVIQLSGGPVPLAVPYMYIAGYTAGTGVPYDVIPLNATQPGQGYIAFDGAQGAYLPWWYEPCENLNNSCVNDYGPIAVQVIDQYGAPVANFPVTWGVTVGSGVIDLDNSDSVTNQNGIAGAAVYLGAAGAQEFAVDVNGMILPFDGYARVPPSINASGVVDAASFTAARAVAPGSWISVFGVNMTDTTQGNNGVNGAFADCGACNVVNQALPMGIDGAAFSFDNSTQSLPGRLNYVSPTQINLQVPWELTGTSAIVKVIVNYTYSAEYTLPLAAYSPGFFVIDTANDVAALDQNYQLVGASNPVARGSYVQLYMNGLGPVTNQPGDGLAAPSNPKALAQTMATPTITIGGQAAPGSFSGLAPGFVSLYQVNVQVPTGISAGAQPITCSIGGVSAKTAQLYVK